MAALSKKNSIVKTPIELQLQKLNLFNISQQKNIQTEYHILKMLNELIINNSQIVNTPVFLSIFNQLMNFQQIETLKMLPLFEMFSYRLWNNETFNYQIREKTSFYKIVSNWIIFFELKSGNLNTIESKFDLISNFMEKQTTTVLERIVMIQQIHEDLKEFIDEEFWKDEEEIDVNKCQQIKSPSKVEKAKDGQISESSLNCILKIIQVLEAIVNPIFYRVHPKQITYKNCTYGTFPFKNVQQLIKKSIYFILKHRNIPSHLQTQISKIALIYLQSLSLEQSAEIVNMLKHLMISTNKAVRFALIIQYVEFYQYLEMMGFQSVIEELENIIYFRELIIGKKMVQENIMEIGNSMNELNLSYHELYIKAGTSKKVYFSNESTENILKLDILLEENDINVKIMHFESVKISDQSMKNINKLVFDTVQTLNQYSASEAFGEKIYWKEDKSTSKKLELRLQYCGLYCIQFDNMYSWVIPKNVKYRLELYHPFR